MKAQISWEAALRRAAVAGKRAILSTYGGPTRKKIVKRGVGGDLTLGIDEASEQAIHTSLKGDLGEESFVFLSEELGEVPNKRKDQLPLVVCDPLDGSHNAQAGIPFFSLALSVIDQGNGKGRILGNVTSALILSIKTEDEYFASKGIGAFHNGRRLRRRAKKDTRFQTLLVETGDIDYLKDKLIARLSTKLVYKVRVLGSAALSYCLLADGSADGYIFAQPGGARTIDSPAGYLIARECGCVFTDLSDRHRDLDLVRVGFDSKLNLVGARESKSLNTLRRFVRSL